MEELQKLIEEMMRDQAALDEFETAIIEVAELYQEVRAPICAPCLHRPHRPRRRREGGGRD